MELYLVDGTYELFRSYYGAPSKVNSEGREVGATAGLIRSLLQLIRDRRVTHIACAFDHVIESFRNELFEGYKTGEGVEPEILDQFELAEEASRALGIVTWPMVHYETDDALATAAARWEDHEEVDRIIICSPDKDFAQCISGKKVVCLNRRTGQILDESGVKVKFGVTPASIPDWLALVGDSADGIPGIKGWGQKTAATVLARYLHLEKIPLDPGNWEISVRGKEKLCRNLRDGATDALLYRDLATLRTDVDLPEDLPDLEWRGICEAGLAGLYSYLGETPPVLDGLED